MQKNLKNNFQLKLTIPNLISGLFAASFFVFLSIDFLVRQSPNNFFAIGLFTASALIFFFIKVFLVKHHESLQFLLQKLRIKTKTNYVAQRTWLYLSAIFLALSFLALYLSLRQPKSHFEGFIGFFEAISAIPTPVTLFTLSFAILITCISYYHFFASENDSIINNVLSTLLALFLHIVFLLFFLYAFYAFFFIIYGIVYVVAFTSATSY